MSCCIKYNDIAVQNDEKYNAIHNVGSIMVQ